MIEALSLIKKLVEQKGYKFTIQRKIILEEILNAERHLKAEEIYERVKKKNIGLATVYRTLEIFTKLGVVKEINANGTNYYEQKLYSKKPLHIHFKCVKCNSITDINEKEVVTAYLKMNKIIEENNEILISDIDIMLLGICKNCMEGTVCQDQ